MFATPQLIKFSTFSDFRSKTASNYVPTKSDVPDHSPVLMGCNCPVTGSYWKLLGATGFNSGNRDCLSFPRKIAQLTACLHRARRRAEQMKDSNYHDMTRRSNQHSGNSHVHFRLTPLTLLLCGSDPEE